MTKLSDLTPDGANANRGSAKGQKMIVASMHEDGFGRSGLLDKNGRIIAGNKTAEASAEVFGVDADVIVVKSDGTKPVYVQRTDLDLTDDDPNNSARKLAFRDNLTSAFSFDLDPDIVLTDITAGFDFAALGVSLPDLSALGVEVGNGRGEPGPSPPTVTEAEKYQERWQVKPGDVWQLGRYKIACVDSTDETKVKKLLDGATVTMVWADPPYGINLSSDTSRLQREKDGWKNKPKNYPKVIGDDTPFNYAIFNWIKCKEQFWWGADYYTKTLPIGGSWLVWDKRVEESLDTMLGSMFELCWSRQPHKREIIRQRWIGLHGTESQDIRSRVHPTQKPVQLPTQLFSKYGKSGDLIFDPFLGSGISVIAAEQLDDGRRVIGCDLAPEYIATTIQRWVDLTGGTPQLLETITNA